MRYPSVPLLVLSALLVGTLPAQTSPTPAPPIRFTQEGTPAVADPKGNVPVLIPQTPRVKVSRRWNEKGTLLRLTIANTYRAPLAISGVQTSGSLYAVSYPAKIDVGSQAELVVAYAPGPAGDGKLDAINLLTDQGVKTIEVEHDREQIFALNQTQLQWTRGDKAARTVYLAVDATIAKPKQVRVLGATQSQAELTEVNPALYAIVITPGEAGKFVVKVEFDPPVEGASPVIYCEISG